MTLDEAIKHCEKVADGQDRLASSYDDGSMGKKLCTECASEHRQLAEWLRELKAYKDARVGCEWCKHKYREQYERPCSLCQRNFMDMFEFEKEVNDVNA